MILQENSAARNRGITLASIKGIIGNVVLVIFKMIVGLASNSIAIILDAVNNLTDVLSSVLTIVGTKLAAKGADKEHPFGHGRIEYMTTMAIAFIILGAGIGSLKESIEKIPVSLHPVVSTDTYRMEVASPKLAVGIRGTDFVDESELYRYKITLKLLFAMMFGWTSKRFQSLYESGKMDNSLTLEVEVEKDFHFVMLTMDTQEPVGLSHQFRSAIKNFDKDPDVTEEHLDTIKSEMFGDFLHGLNSLEYIATQYEPQLMGENLFDLPKILQDISLNDVIKLGHRFIDQCDMTDFTIFPK